MQSLDINGARAELAAEGCVLQVIEATDDAAWIGRTQATFDRNAARVVAVLPLDAPLK